MQLFVSVRRESQDAAPRSRPSAANEESNERAQRLHFRTRARRRAAVPRARSASQQHCERYNHAVGQVFSCRPQETS